MTGITSQEIRDKIKAVTEDLKKQETEKGRIALSGYIDYLKYELREAELAERSNKSSK
jgi:hypothetical protein